MSSREYILRLEMRTLETEVENERLRRENEILRNRLRFYENPNTPPSQLTLKKKFRDERVEKKGGAPKGHRGATRKKREPDEVIQLSTECRPYCSHELGEPIRTETRIIEDLPPPSKIKVTQFDIDVYGSPNCGAEVKGKHRDCPQVGGFGIYLLVYMTMLKYHLKGPLRKVRDFLCYNDSFEISPKGVRDGLLRVGDACKNEYGELIQRIRNSRWVHVDETGMKVNGEKWWLWIFRTDKADVLTVIRKSGGKNVPQEILGEHKGVMIADDWRAYNRFVLQRCWAHLIREVDDFKAQSKEGERLSADIHLKFEELKELLGKGPPIDERELMKIRLDMGMEELVERHSAYKEIEEPVTYIRNGLSSWYTCLLYPGMEPTNNLGEQALREHVIMRKIIGTFRSENGSVNYQYIASMLAAWKLQGKNPFEELESLLRKELCLK